jgi:hypothetical protein
MVRMPDETRQGTQHVWNVFRVASAECDYAEDEDHSGKGDKANADKHEHAQPPMTACARLAAVLDIRS